MAKIPVYNDLQVAPSNVAQVQFAQQGNLFAGLGKGLEQAGAGAMDVYESVSTTRAQDSLNQFSFEAKKAEIEYRTKQGQAAIDALPEYEKKLETLRNQYVPTDNPYAAKLYNSKSTEIKNNSTLSGLGHFGQENFQYASSVKQKTAMLATDDLTEALLTGNEKAVSRATENLNLSVTELSNHLGEEPTIRTQAHLAKSVSSAVNYSLTNPASPAAQAQSILETNKAALPADVYTSLKTQVEHKQSQQETSDIATKAVAEIGTNYSSQNYRGDYEANMSDLTKYVSTLPKHQQDEVLRKGTMEIARQKAISQGDVFRMQDAIMQSIDKTGVIDPALSAKMPQYFTPDEIDKMQSYALMRGQGGQDVASVRGRLLAMNADAGKTGNFKGVIDYLNESRQKGQVSSTGYKVMMDLVHGSQSSYESYVTKQEAKYNADNSRAEWKRKAENQMKLRGGWLPNTEDNQAAVGIRDIILDEHYESLVASKKPITPEALDAAVNAALGTTTVGGATWLGNPTEVELKNSDIYRATSIGLKPVPSGATSAVDLGSRFPTAAGLYRGFIHGEVGSAEYKKSEKDVLDDYLSNNQSKRLNATAAVKTLYRSLGGGDISADAEKSLRAHGKPPTDANIAFTAISLIKQRAISASKHKKTMEKLSSDPFYNPQYTPIN